ncbi:radical SAM family heme chaperone HemW [Sediminibacterium sp.]|uniref:radical SAM family heme chaperone HemW n=1 Tax=Sediminibacterium sp. TaxID=1917865 RepID=UPI0025EF0691|nr:radical SAM family heme chaperone HemW [Sediminibacterium sp.]MBW0178862.1 radical SAM family heme chaperone HemW [Sediminibacterium sp.]
MSGIYIHIPFCRKACHYCNFHFSTSQQSRTAMAAAIAKEAVIRKDFITGTVSTIYFGGGTPSLLTAAELMLMMDIFSSHFSIATDAEITLEANPDDISPDKLLEWKKAGINRLSIGIQSFFEEDLQWMNRAHNASQAKNCIQLAQDAGFHNLTIDLIYGTPGLSNERWITNIETAISFNIPHLSCYALTVEPNTALDKLIQKGTKADVDQQKQAVHFDLLTTRLEAAGFEHYEISNFARPGFRSRHNSSYWQGKPYLGLGPSAHSFNGSIRQWNISNNALYLKSIEQDLIPFEAEQLTDEQQLNEYIMTSLRTMEGCSLELIEKKWGEKNVSAIKAAAQKYLQEEYLNLSGNQLILTKKGKFLADGIAAELFQLN